MPRWVFFNTGWMRKYDGLDHDAITMGGRYPQRHKYGGEIFNFRSFEGRYYGYVQPPGRNGTIRVKRIDSNATDEVDNVLVIWTASNEEHGGTFVVGWYKNATVYRSEQEVPRGSDRLWNGEELGYYATARIDDSRLLGPDQRTIKVPRGKRGFGQAHIYYGESLSKSKTQEILKFVQQGGGEVKSHRPARSGANYQADPYRRRKVEESAIRKVTEYYEGNDFEVRSVESDNCGWDLEAHQNDVTLRIEVKGLSQKHLSIELTPNEYRAVKERDFNHRICVVTDALETVKLRIFRPVVDSSGQPKGSKTEKVNWEDDEGNKLRITEVIAARAEAVA